MSRSTLSLLLGAASLGISPAGLAADPEFQAYFFNVCVNPTGALATRCGETAGGLGNLSGDSESSLNPSQSLSSNDSPLSRGRTRSKQAREGGERLRDSAEETGDAPGGPFSLLVHFRGDSFESERNASVDAERGLEGDLWGAEIGFDYRLSDRAVIGTILGFEHSEADFDPENPGVNFTPAVNAGDITDDGTAINFFGAVDFAEAAYFEGSIGYASSDFEFRRNSVFQESGRAVPQTNVRTLGESSGDQQWVALNLGINKQRNAVSFGPYFGATYTRSTVDAYTEQDLAGTGLAMAFAETERKSLIGHLGFRVAIAKSTEGGVVVPQFRFEYEYESDNDPEPVTASFLLDAAQSLYVFTGDEPDRNQFETGFGVAWILRNGWLPFLDIEVLSGNDRLDRYRLAAGFRVEF
jgi:outer membrane autotransporter protein